jgi:hypothetical protein
MTLYATLSTDVHRRCEVDTRAVAAQGGTSKANGGCDAEAGYIRPASMEPVQSRTWNEFVLSSTVRHN